MTELIRRQFDELLQTVPDWKRGKADAKLTAFCTMVGSKAEHRELMVVGRAVNGWDDVWTKEEITNDAKRQAIVATGLAGAESLVGRGRGKDLMLDIIRYWHEPVPESICEGYQGYRFNRSAFFRVTRSVIEKLTTTTPEDWAAHLIWTNLYKVSPAGGGNPPSSLATLLFERSAALLSTEIVVCRPKRVLFLTGRDWVDPFLEHLGDVEIEALHERQGLTERCGRLRIKGHEPPVTFVVAKHPQGKPEHEMVGRIQSMFGDVCTAS